MSIIIYYLLLLTPLVFLIRRPRRELYAVAGLIVLFMLINGRFVNGEQTVSWDALFWSTEFQYLRELIQAGHMPGWNPFFNGGEPLYMYHQHYAMWQWFLFAVVDKVFPINPVTLFNLSFVFLFIFYNVGCYLLFSKLFADTRVALYCLAVSLLSVAFIMFFQEFESLHISIYFPYIVYFFIEFMENRSWAALGLSLAAIGVGINAYVPNYLILAVTVFVIVYLVFMDKQYIKWPRLASKKIVYAGAGILLMTLTAIPVLFLFVKWSAFTSPMRTGLENYMNPVQAVTGHHQDYNAIFNLFTIPTFSGLRAKLFIGIIPVVFAIVGLIKSKNRFRWVITFFALVLYFISLGRNSFFYVIIHFLPTFSQIRNYVEFEFFVQLFLVCLSGMGFEHILSLKKEEKLKAASYVITGFFIAVLIYLASWYQEHKQSTGHLFSISLYGFLLFFSVGGVALLIRARSRNALVFFWMILLLTLGTSQWYFGYLNYDSLRITRDSTELTKLHSLLKTDTEFSWNETRALTADQRLQVAESYNTFEPALHGVERAFSEPVEKNLLITKRYYDLKDLRDEKFEYFGVNYPKIFLTENYSIVPQDMVINAMEGGYQDFIQYRKIYFAADDLPKITDVDALGNLRTEYDTGLKQAALTSRLYGKVIPARSEDGAINDSLTHLSDEYDVEAEMSIANGDSKNGWRVFNSSSTFDIDAEITETGGLVMALDENSSFFRDKFNAPYVYKELNGDFDVETMVSGNAQKDNERAGIIIRDASHSNLQNWIAMLAGSSLGRDVHYLEESRDGRTDSNMYDSDEMHIRATRMGQYFTFFTRKTPDSKWTLRRRYSKPDFSETVQVGLGAQNNNQTGKYVAAFDWFRLHDVKRASANISNDDIKVLDYTPDKAVFSVLAPGARLLVYLQNYDTDWRAYVNGSRVPIRRVNYNFQAIAVPTGKSTVEFRYRSVYLYALALHLAAAVITVIWMGLYLVKRNNRISE